MSPLVFSTPYSSIFFFFNDPATTEIYTLSLHDALPISLSRVGAWGVIKANARRAGLAKRVTPHTLRHTLDRKSTRLNSSHITISYAVFCLKKKNKQQTSH